MHTRAQRSVRGRENAKNYLLQNPLICEEIENQVRELHGLEAQHVVPGEMAAETARRRHTGCGDRGRRVKSRNSVTFHGTSETAFLQTVQGLL